MENETTLDLFTKTQNLTEEEKCTWLEKLEMAGRRIAKTNHRLERFALMLTHPEFAKFFDENFNDWVECQQSIMLLKTGICLRDAISKTTGETVSGNQLISAIKSALDHQDTRKLMIQSLYDFMNVKKDQLTLQTKELV